MSFAVWRCHHQEILCWQLTHTLTQWISFIMAKSLCQFKSDRDWLPGSVFPEFSVVPISECWGTTSLSSLLFLRPRVSVADDVERCNNLKECFIERNTNRCLAVISPLTFPLPSRMNRTTGVSPAKSSFSDTKLGSSVLRFFFFWISLKSPTIM
jgi:hypothetical protein